MKFQLFKTIDPPEKLIAKDLGKLKQHVITITHEGKDYKLYELVSIYDMPSKRYAALNDFIEDKRRGLDKEELNQYVDECVTSLEEWDNNGVADALILLKSIKARMRVAADVDLIMRLLSCSLFFDDEDLKDYDWDIGTFKIELFESYGVSAFFLTEPIKKYWTRIDISKKDMEIILNQRSAKKRLLKELSDMVMKKQSKETS